jgi:hypothetical protein
MEAKDVAVVNRISGDGARGGGRLAERVMQSVSCYITHKLRLKVNSEKSAANRNSPDENAVAFFI